MPIILDDLQKNLQQQPAKAALPSYFSKSLTGSGKKTGLLNGSLLPLRRQDPSMVPKFPCMDVLTTVSSGTTDFELIPMNLYEAAKSFQHIHALPEAAEPIHPAGVPENEKIWCLVTMKNAVLATDNRTGSQTATVKVRTLYPIYYISFFWAQKIDQNGDIALWWGVTVEDQALEADSFDVYARNHHPKIEALWDKALLNAYFDSLTVFEIASNTAAIWASHVPAMFKAQIENRCTDVDLAYMAMRLNSYSISLEDYWKIYENIERLQPSALNAVCEQNLNLLLNGTLKDLAGKKANIPMFQAVTPYVSDNINPSPEQLDAITTTEPCVIVQSSAGTGKSFTIRHRLRYMEQCGVNLENTMVLSFTNAAADHIKEIAPQVNSKTIASMIHDIYALNWTHQLSTIDTMLNILYANKALMYDPVAQSLVNGLRILRKDVNSGLVSLSATIKNNFDAVIYILDTINQTTLELESLICYHAGANIKEPSDLCEHVIMDEVQDNSIFEFIYIIRYIIRHNASLYLIGDGSQTLYEFRASDPKALNCLEMSGIFACKKLQTNYRSNQNILDFANLTLATIEANRIARLRLQANSFLVDDFEKNVQVAYHQLSNRSTALRTMIPSMLVNIQDWIRDKLAKNEQICFLAYRRKDLTPFESFVETVFPDKSLINIVPAKTYPQAFFSKYVYACGEQLYHRPGADVTAEVSAHMMGNAAMLVKTSQEDLLRSLIAEWRQKAFSQLMLADRVLQANGMSIDDFKAQVFQSLIDFEIEKNAMKQRIVSMRNQELKTQDMSSFNFIVSTIHSAKGLEFDNVILLYDESAARDEESKRMYYVGLTRAKNAEYILAYNTNHGSTIQNAWETMKTAKATKAKEAVAQASQEASGSSVMLKLALPGITKALIGESFTLPLPGATALAGAGGLRLPGPETPVHFYRAPARGQNLIDKGVAT